jgi:protease-4
MSNRGLIGRLARGLWRGLDAVRKVLHLMLLVILLLIVIASLGPQLPRVPGSAALLIAPEGTLVDQLSGDPLERALAKARGIPARETLLKDVVDAIRAARDDTRIRALVLKLDGLSGAGLSKLQELRDELGRFKESGKPVIAVGDGYTRDQYYLAAQADEVYMHPMGFVFLDGYSRFLPYFKSALDKLYVDYEVWTVGEYKSFVEPITRDNMSEQDREASGAYLSALWDSYQADVTAARQLPENALDDYANNAVQLLSDADGDAAQMAVSYGLVDELLTHDLVRQRLQQVVGPDQTNRDDYSRIDYQQYLRAVRPEAEGSNARSKIAVIVASGEIKDGNQPPGTVGGESTAKLIRRAARDADVKALVLRVDSPGGSAFASDVILRELVAFQQTHRPLVVSMGSVAASGGYWISMSADEIWASPTTLTGSIGVGATLPTFPRTLDHLGVHVDGLGTTDLSGQFSPLRGLGGDAKQLLRQSIEHAYTEFVSRVAQYRGQSVDQIDRVARGRVWVGSDALARGLVDKLGHLDDAVDSAARLAGLEPDQYRIEYVRPELSFSERLALQYAQLAVPFLKLLGPAVDVPPAVRKLLETAEAPLAAFESFNDPRGMHAYCFCDVR